MKKTVLTLFASALLAGSVMSAATANERHHHARTYRTAPVFAEPYRDHYARDYRDSCACSYPDYSYLQSRAEGGVISPPAGH